MVLVLNVEAVMRSCLRLSITFARLPVSATTVAVTLVTSKTDTPAHVATTPVSCSVWASTSSSVVFGSCSERVRTCTHTVWFCDARGEGVMVGVEGGGREGASTPARLIPQSAPVHPNWQMQLPS